MGKVETQTSAILMHAVINGVKHFPRVLSARDTVLRRRGEKEPCRLLTKSEKWVRVDIASGVAGPCIGDGPSRSGYDICFPSVRHKDAAPQHQHDESKQSGWSEKVIIITNLSGLYGRVGGRPCGGSVLRFGVTPSVLFTLSPGRLFASKRGCLQEITAAMGKHAPFFSCAS